MPERTYAVSVNCKKRYVIPLVAHDTKTCRIDQLSEMAKKLLDEYLAFEDSKYCYIEGIGKDFSEVLCHF